MRVHGISKEDMAHIFRTTEISVDDIDFGAPKRSSTGRVTLSPTFKGKRLLFQTPPMDAPFGVSTAKEDPKRKYLDLSFRGMEKNPAIEQYKVFIEQLEKKIKMFTKEHAEELLGSVAKKGLSDETLDVFYRGVIREARDPEKYAPTIRYKVLTGDDGKGLVEVFQNRNTKIPIETLPKGGTCICIVELQSIWFSANMFGPTFKLHIVRYKPPSKVSGYIFFDEDEDEEEEDTEMDDDFGFPPHPSVDTGGPTSTKTVDPPPLRENNPEEDAL